MDFRDNFQELSGIEQGQLLDELLKDFELRVQVLLNVPKRWKRATKESYALIVHAKD